jgi:hypothetical protein
VRPTRRCNRQCLKPLPPRTSARLAQTGHRLHRQMLEARNLELLWSLAADVMSAIDA